VTSRCSIGVDFGTESGRVLVLDVDSGEELATRLVLYPHGVIDRALPGGGRRLGSDWALQHPEDWTHVITTGVPAALSAAGVGADQVVGLGVDFTSCTVLPADGAGRPLCLDDAWREHPHAWPKLWKHHAAQPVADRLNEVAGERGESFLSRYGGRISSEWYFPKLIEVWLEDPAVYDATAAFVEATDWIVWWLTGDLVRQSTTAGYKAMWSPEDGLPSTDYFTDAYPGFDAPDAKLGSSFVALGTAAGTLRPDLADRLGLNPDTAVAVGNVDSFVSVPGAGVSDNGTFVAVIGTSICSMVLADEEVRLPGITGVARDGILPGRFGYEAGQVAVGDMLGWFARTVDESHTALEVGAAQIPPGASGLLALDWWNGNRSVLADADLTGTIIGLGLQTTRAEIYRSLVEAIALSNRRIIENFTGHGVEIDRIVACGGIAVKSPLAMQIVADSSGLEVAVPASDEVPARGAALFGAVAAGVFANIEEATAATRPGTRRLYEPDPDAHAVYDEISALHHELYDLLGTQHADLMHRLKRLATQRGG
jgi:L-ribulokinase